MSTNFKLHDREYLKYKYCENLGTSQSPDLSLIIMSRQENTICT